MTESDVPAPLVIVEKEASLAWIVLNRPERLNAITSTMLDEMSAALSELARDDAVRVVAIRGAGRAFSAGYDMRGGDGEGAVHDAVADRDRLTRNVERFLEIWDYPKPVIAAVHGYCLAGATQLCVFCDLTIVADTARIGWPVLPTGGGYISPIWTTLVGPKRAKEMAFIVGSEIDAATAVQWGWANSAVPEDRLWDSVRETAARIARTPADLLKMKKVAINRVVELQGFRMAVTLGVEVDALLHQSDAVREVRAMIRDVGLREAVATFRDGRTTA